MATIQAVLKHVAVTCLVTSLICALAHAQCQSAEEPLPVECVCKGVDAVECKGLSAFPAASSFGASVKVFNFMDCTFPTIDQVNYPNAEELIIRNSGVTDIQDNAFTLMTSLRLLDVSENPSLAPLRRQMFTGVPTLKKLILLNDNIKQVEEDTFDDLGGLEALVLSGNTGIEFADGCLTKHPVLSHINLDGCALTEPPVKVLSEAPALGQLDLNGNNFGELGEDAFFLLENLEELNMDSCQITKLDHTALSGLTKLHTLNLGYNQIDHICDMSLSGSKSTMRHLMVEHNKLTKLGPDLVEWSMMETVLLNNNPWNCDCALSWMAGVELHTTFPDNNKNVTCATPEEYAGKSVQNITQHLECPCGTKPCEAEGSSMVALAVAIPIVVVCALLIGYYLYKIMQSRKERDENRKSVRYSAVYKDTTEPNKDKHNAPIKPTSEL